MCNDVQLGEVIRGHTGNLRFDGDPRKGFILGSQEHALKGKPAPPGGNLGLEGKTFAPEQPHEDTYALWEHFLGCMRSRNPETLCPAELGYAAIATVNLGVQSYRDGKAYFFEKETGQVTPADESWAKKWEKIGHQRGKPAQVAGWKAGEEGSLLHLPDYQKLEGDWIDGKDPAASI
jgi:hypothetical protein